MDMTIAKWQISVHRAIPTHFPEMARTASRAADALTRQVNRAKQAREYEQQRERTLQWFLLHGGH